LNVCVPQAAVDLIKVDMVAMLVKLCIFKINQLHWLQEAVTSNELEISRQELAMMDEEKNECLTLMSEVLEEIHRRIVEIESPTPKD
jgi:hypothetical protein